MFMRAQQQRASRWPSSCLQTSAVFTCLYGSIQRLRSTQREPTRRSVERREQQKQQEQLCRHETRAHSYYTTDTVTQEAFQDDEYEATDQAQRRKSWAAAVRSATGRKHHIAWEPQLNPPLLLDRVTVVLVGPKKPISCGTIARSCSCFEINDLRLVQPRCQPNSRSSRSVSKGAQWILHRSRIFDSLSAALSDVDLSVAMTRWLPEQPNHLSDVPSLLQHPTVQQLLHQPLGGPAASRVQQTNDHHQQQPPSQLAQLDSRVTGPQQQQQHQQPAAAAQEQQAGSHSAVRQQQPGPVRVALVFGREEFGLSDEEVEACDVACAIPIGRLQESLSLSHAVTVVLSQLYQARLAATAKDPLAAACRVTRPDELAEGCDSSGTEH